MEFRVGSAEKLPVEDGSVSLITAFCAAHWFDLPSFYAECDRVLTRGGGGNGSGGGGNGGGGVIALGVYNKVIDFTSTTRPIWENDVENADKTAKLQQIVDDFKDGGVLAWSPGRQLAKDGYRHLPMPERGYFIRRQDCFVDVEYSLKELVGYFTTLSGE